MAEMPTRVTLFTERLGRGVHCVMVPKKTENWLRFSARLDAGVPEVHLERAVRI